MGLENWNLGNGFGDSTSENRSWGGEETVREENGENTTQSDSDGYGNCNSGFSNWLWSVSMHFSAASHFLFDLVWWVSFCFGFCKLAKTFGVGKVVRQTKIERWVCLRFWQLGFRDWWLGGWVALYTEFSSCWIVQ